MMLSTLYSEFCFCHCTGTISQ
uniref:Uncharacterized protein n=1 Tax=Arundo donax TaxID=35708 RepID=A0A0A9C8E8_ARUDO